MIVRLETIRLHNFQKCLRGAAWGAVPGPDSTHYELLPVNRPRVPVRTYHADGPMRFDAPKGRDAYYEPNSFGGPVQDKRFAEPPLGISGDADRYNHRDGNDDYTQPAIFFG